MIVEITLGQTASYSRRFTLDNLDIRGQVVRLGSAWQSLMDGRDYPADIHRYLGELACVAVLVGTGLKHAGRATLQIQGSTNPDSNAPKRGARLVVVDCTHQLGLRGMALTDREAEASNGFADWVGGGTLALTVLNTDNGQQYQSIVPVSGLSVAECLPTHLWIEASATGAGALLLQKLPGADAKDADGWARMEQLAASVTSDELLNIPVDVLLRRLFAEEDIRLYEPKTVTSACKRDEEKVKNMLRSLGREEVEATLAAEGEVIVKDDMCNQEYRFDKAAVEALFAESADG
jgi:molecular chaperone Hsp33